MLTRNIVIEKQNGDVAEVEVEGAINSDDVV